VRSVPPKHIPANLPDPLEIFDKLLARAPELKKLPANASSLLLAFADIVSCDLFSATNKNDETATTSSHLDLSPLYGSNKDIQRSIRTMVDGRLKTDTFAEVEFINQPPHVSSHVEFRRKLLTMKYLSMQHCSFAFVVSTTVLQRNLL
jgi:hypothetical protein